MATRERVLTAQELKESTDHANRAMSNLGIANAQVESDAICQAVEDFVDRWLAEKRNPNPLKKLFSRAPALNVASTALGLSFLWGNQLVRRFGWVWTCVQKDNLGEAYAVVTPDRSVVVYPTHYIKGCLDDPKADCTIMLAFNMLVAGEITGVPPKGYENLMLGVRRIVPKR